MATDASGGAEVGGSVPSSPAATPSAPATKAAAKEGDEAKSDEQKAEEGGGSGRQRKEGWQPEAKEWVMVAGDENGQVLVWSITKALAPFKLRRIPLKEHPSSYPGYNAHVKIYRDGELLTDNLEAQAHIRPGAAADFAARLQSGVRRRSLVGGVWMDDAGALSDSSDDEIYKGSSVVRASLSMPVGRRGSIRRSSIGSQASEIGDPASRGRRRRSSIGSTLGSGEPHKRADTASGSGNNEAPTFSRRDVRGVVLLRYWQAHTSIIRTCEVSTRLLSGRSSSMPHMQSPFPPLLHTAQPLQIVHKPKCIVTSSDDLLVRIWNFHGSLLGELQPRKWQLRPACCTAFH